MSDPLDPLDLELAGLGLPEGAAPLATAAQLLHAAAPIAGLAGWKLAGALAATALLGAGAGAGVLQTITPEPIVQTVVQTETVTVVETVVETVVQTVEVPVEVLVRVPGPAVACTVEPEPAVALAAIELDELDEELDFDLAWLEGLPSPTLPEEPTAVVAGTAVTPGTTDARGDWALRMGVAGGASLGRPAGIAATGSVVRYGAERELGRPTLTTTATLGTSGRGATQSASLGAGLTRERLDATWLVASRRELVAADTTGGQPELPPIARYTAWTGPEVGVRLADGRVRLAANTLVGQGTSEQPVDVVAGLSLSLESLLRGSL